MQLYIVLSYLPGLGLFTLPIHVLTESALNGLPSYITHPIPLLKLYQQFRASLVHILTQCLQLSLLHFQGLVSLTILQLQLYSKEEK